MKVGTRMLAGSGILATVVAGVIISFADKGISRWFSDPPARNNSAPTILGTPRTAISVNEDYEFRVAGLDSDGDALFYSISNLPVWGTFDPTTGTLRGRPGAANVGSYSDITISVSDGKSSASLPSFQISVFPPTPPPVHMSSVEVDTDRFGGDYKDFQSTGLEDCLAACVRDEPCAAVSFNVAANQCWMKSTVPLRQARAGFTSAVKVH